jgi:hypothetical protein
VPPRETAAGARTEVLGVGRIVGAVSLMSARPLSSFSFSSGVAFFSAKPRITALAQASVGFELASAVVV